MMINTNTLLMIIPLLLIWLILIIINLINISKKEKTKYLTKPIWIAIILVFSYIGNIAYLLLESDKNDSD